MKRENLFMINLDNDDTVIDRDELILRRENSQIKSDRAMLDEKFGKAILKNAFGGHAVMTIFSALFLIAGICSGVAALVDYLDNETLFTFPFHFTVIFLILAGIFAIFKKTLKKKNEENSPIDALDGSYARLNAISRRDLGVPSDAKTVEIFGHFYNGDSAPDEPYDVDEVMVFEEDGNLCLYHEGVVIAVPKDAIEAVVKLSDTVTFSDWMKDVPYDSEEYSQYHIQKRKVDEYNEEYSMQGCYSIRFAVDRALLEILVPLYEVDPFLDILKLEVIEE